MKRFLSVSIAILMICLNITMPTYATPSDYVKLDLTKTNTYLNVENNKTAIVSVKGLTSENILEQIDNTSGDLTFESNADYILSVDASGNLTAKNPGVAVITVTYKNQLTQSIVIVVTRWSSGRGFNNSFETPTDANVTNEAALIGSYSYNGTKSTYYGMISSGDILEMFFYDNGTTTNGSVAARDKDPLTMYYVVGVDTALSSNAYVIKSTGNNKNNLVTSVNRSVGWHQVIIDLKVVGKQEVYLDGVKIFEDTQTINPLYWMRSNQVTGTGNMMYYDAFSTYSMVGDPVAHNLRIEGDVVPGGTLTASYDFYVPRGLAESGSLIKWQKSTKIDTGFETISGQTGTTLQIPSDGGDYFYRFLITPKTSALTGAEVTSPSKTKAMAPEARGVYVIGSVNIGKVLQGNYTFYDINGDRENGTRFEWYISDEEDGQYNKIQGADGQSYTVVESDVGKYIKFAVTPVTDEGELLEGTKVYSDVVLTAVVPEAKSVSISGEHALGAVLTGSYTYYDKNNDNEGTSTLKWYRINSANQSTEVGSGSTYTITNADIDCSIVFSVTPVASVEPFTGLEVKSDPFKGPAVPVADSVIIDGTAKAGNILVGKYEYKHTLGAAEGKSKYNWYLSDGSSKLKDVCQEASILVTSEMEGCYLVFEVTPYASVEPCEGVKVVSTPVYVSKPAKSQVKTGGGGGGGGTYKPPVIPTPQPTTTPNIPVTVPKADVTKIVDIADHWAKDDIIWAINEGVTVGTSETTFEPEATVTRAQMATLLSRIAKIAPAKYKGEFSDVDASEWYADYIQAMKDAKIIEDEGNFRPEENIKRVEMAVMVMRTYEYLTKTTITVGQKQVLADREALNTWDEIYVDKAMELGIIKGMGDNYFKPKLSSTRAQAVAVIKRLTDNLGGLVK